MLGKRDARATLPAQDLQRAKAFYSDRLGLEVIEENPGAIGYRSGDTIITVFATPPVVDQAVVYPRGRNPTPCTMPRTDISRRSVEVGIFKGR
ncbi:MAG: hypothetical protein DLM70_02635 [Chloroflexi bacterium]|nr:MAG: hypothetical protein DLM70_02635 [Chloroflexota bacterium]